MIVQSTTKKGWLLKIGEPIAGEAYIEIDGKTHHLDKPYLSIKYVPGGSKEKVWAGYEVIGLFVENVGVVTTTKFLAILKNNGFLINGVLSAPVFRAAITKGLCFIEKEKNKTLSRATKKSWKARKRKQLKIPA
jgi:hypothetical protein